MKQNLLVVDDDPPVLKALTKLLVADGYEVLAASDGAGALNHFKSGLVDLVVLDLNLGTDDGWDVFRRMAEVNPFVPTVIITAECGQHDLARTAGVEALVEKPIDVPSFLQIVHDLLAETSESRLKRICSNSAYCRYVSRHYEPYLRLLQERYAAPFRIASDREHPPKIQRTSPTVIAASASLFGQRRQTHPISRSSSPSKPSHSPHEDDPLEQEG